MENKFVAVSSGIANVPVSSTNLSLNVGGNRFVDNSYLRTPSLSDLPFQDFTSPLPDGLNRTMDLQHQLSTPTTQILFPAFVTEEQEKFAGGFMDVLKMKQRQGSPNSLSSSSSSTSNNDSSRGKMTQMQSTENEVIRSASQMMSSNLQIQPSSRNDLLCPVTSSFIPQSIQSSQPSFTPSNSTQSAVGSWIQNNQTSRSVQYQHQLMQQQQQQQHQQQQRQQQHQQQQQQQLQQQQQQQQQHLLLHNQQQLQHQQHPQNSNGFAPSSLQNLPAPNNTFPSNHALLSQSLAFRAENSSSPNMNFERKPIGKFETVDDKELIPSVDTSEQAYFPPAEYTSMDQTMSSWNPNRCSSASPSSMGTSDVEEQERMKLERKRAKNREAAQRCQQRKMERISRLENKVEHLRDQNTSLNQTVVALRMEISRLQQQIVTHTSRGCHLMLPGSNMTGRNLLQANIL